MVGTGNVQNLHHFTSEEGRNAGKKGGVASGKARREKKAMAEQMRDLLDIPRKKGKVTSFESIKVQKDIENGNFTIEQEMLLATVQKARKGDLRAVQLVREILGIQDIPTPVSPLEEFASELSKYEDDDEE